MELEEQELRAEEERLDSSRNKQLEFERLQGELEAMQGRLRDRQLNGLRAHHCAIKWRSMVQQKR